MGRQRLLAAGVVLVSLAGLLLAASLTGVVTLPWRSGSGVKEASAFAVRPVPGSSGFVSPSSPALSPGPDTLHFNGVLTDSSGDPVPEGSKQMKFSIWDAETLGNQKWPEPPATPEEQTVTVRKSGVISVYLGTVESFPEGLFDTGSLFLEIEVEGGSGFETLTPRLELAKVPRAFFADKAGEATAAEEASSAEGVKRRGFSITTLDSRPVPGWGTSITVGADGLPIISYHDEDNGNLMVAKCDNAACTSATITTVDSGDSVGAFPSVAVGAEDGLPIISYYDWMNADLKVAKCADQACTSATLTTLASTGIVGRPSSITAGAGPDGQALISYYDDSTDELRTARCTNAACTSAIFATVDAVGDVGGFSSVTVGADGLPIISYYDFDNGDLKVAHCSNDTCTSSTTSTIDDVGDAGQGTSITIGTDGLPVISYVANSGLMVAHCSNAACTSGATKTALEWGIGGVLQTSVTLGADGLPVISYGAAGTTELKVAHCSDVACTSANIVTVYGPVVGPVAEFSSVTIGVDGQPIISYYESNGGGDLKVVKCSNPFCVPYWTRR